MWPELGPLQSRRGYVRDVGPAIQMRGQKLPAINDVKIVEFFSEADLVDAERRCRREETDAVKEPARE